MKGIAADLVIVNATGASYAQGLQESFEDMVRASQAVGQRQPWERGGVFLLRAELVPPRDQILLGAAARVVLLANRGTLSEQLVRLEGPRPGPVPPRLRTPRERAEVAPPPALDLALGNGLGGFAAEGREYVTVLGPGQWTPAPWLNVIANPEFGFQVSESGSGYTWSVNSRAEQAHALVERSRERHAGRDVLRARRGQRPGLGADPSPDSRRVLALRDPARPGLQPLRAHLPRHRAGAPAVRTGSRLREDLAPHSSRTSRAANGDSR